jgi:peptidyl-tRNA hydrolase
MEALDTKLRKPTKYEQQMAKQSCTSLFSAMEQIKNDYAEIEIEETRAKIVVPIKALKMLGEILKAMSKGNPITIVPQATEVTIMRCNDTRICIFCYLRYSSFSYTMSCPNLT